MAIQPTIYQGKNTDAVFGVQTNIPLYRVDFTTAPATARPTPRPTKRLSAPAMLVCCTSPHAHAHAHKSRPLTLEHDDCISGGRDACFHMTVDPVRGENQTDKTASVSQVAVFEATQM